MVYGITDLTTFVLGTIVIVLLPGPNSLYVMTVASQHGVSAGYRGALGIFTGDLILMTLAATGDVGISANDAMTASAPKAIRNGRLWGASRLTPRASDKQGETEIP